MSAKKITAPDVREALRLLHKSLGPDAVILSNKSVDGKVEILAVGNEDMHALIDAAEAGAPMRMLAPGRDPAPPPAPDMAGSVVQEIREMRSMFESSLAELSMEAGHRRDPARAHVMREMVTSGFSAGLARYLSEKQPDAPDGIQDDRLVWVKRTLSRNLATIDDESGLFSQGGIFALVGPTGVGKTTTTAKLAARVVLQHGPSRVALISTDTFRIGAYEQLRMYGSILKVPVHSVNDESDMAIALSDLQNKHTILIDTVGMSQRDKMVAEQLAMLMDAGKHMNGTGKQIKRILCLNAGASGETLSEVARAYASGGLAGCILTKLDEAASIGGALDVIVRHKLPLFYIANGQRVPEDIAIAKAADLVERAFKLKADTAAFHLRGDELSLLAGASMHALSDPSLRGVDLG